MMTSFWRIMSSIMIFFLTLPINAVDIPTTVIGAEQYTKEQCISSNTNDCIESVCMHSSNIDCQEHCKSEAIDKCAAMAEQ